MIRDLIRRVAGDPAPEGSRERRIIVGLGNPGSKYENTRHNIGFRVVDELARRLPEGHERSRFNAALLELQDETHGDLVLVKPMTMMNLSGNAVSQVQKWFKVPPDRLLLVYDDLDLALGKVRLRPGGGAGGHNGVQSVIDQLGTPDFPRLRVGIGRPTHGSTINYVLSPFRPEEREIAGQVVEFASDAALAWIREGIDNAMNTYNRRNVESGTANSAT